MTYGNHIGNKKVTPQTKRADSRQVRNAAGGFTFAVDCWKRLERFLILGADGGTYYVSEKRLTKQNAKNVLSCLRDDARRTVDTIVDVSVKGRAPKEDPAIFALALCVVEGDRDAKALALGALTKVCRTGTHLFQWVTEFQALGGSWGRSVVRAVANWYLEKEPRNLALQLVKYQQRMGWTHADIFRLCHPKVQTDGHKALARWLLAPELLDQERSVWRKSKPTVIMYPQVPKDALPEIVPAAVEALHLNEERDVPRLIELIQKYRLPRECVPTSALRYPQVWEALLEDMPVNALVRNLGKMTSVGILGEFGDGEKKVISILSNREALKKARLHPIKVLVALAMYRSGHGDKGALTWRPNHRIVSALDDTFYASFDVVEPTGKNHYLGIDVSASMSDPSSGTPLSCREVAAALAMVTARTEPNSVTFGFTHRMVDLKITARDTLADAMAKAKRSDFQRTDCAQPMIHALEEKLPIHVFNIYTDNETYFGHIHPHQALRQFRNATGIRAKLGVVAITSAHGTIADPDDAGMMDVSGFDTSVPAVLADFARD